MEKSKENEAKFTVILNELRGQVNTMRDLSVTIKSRVSIFDGSDDEVADVPNDKPEGIIGELNGLINRIKQYNTILSEIDNNLNKIVGSTKINN